MDINYEDLFGLEPEETPAGGEEQEVADPVETEEPEGEEEQELVREWFNPLTHDMNDFVFQGNEFQGNSLNLHRIRSNVAKRAYRFYVEKMK